MKPIQLILIAVALVAALGAGFLMMNVSNQPAPVVVDSTEPIVTVPLKKVLVATNDIPMGTTLTDQNMSWEEWPETGVRESFVTQDRKPEAMEEYSKAIARSSFFAGEPIRDQKIVRSDSGYLSAILPAGKRAVAVRVSAESSAGGFILPNDHVDAIMSYKKDGEEGWITETVLQNVRVLAIDQVIEEQDGEKAKVGQTATLELTAEQVEILSVANSIARNGLMLALRSVEDAELASSDAGAHLLSSKSRRRKGTIRIIRYGASIEKTPKN